MYRRRCRRRRLSYPPPPLDMFFANDRHTHAIAHTLTYKRTPTHTHTHTQTNTHIYTHTNRLGETSLHYAVRAGKINIVGLLLDHGADPTVGSEQGTPMEVAKRKNHRETLKLLETGR